MHIILIIFAFILYCLGAYASYRLDKYSDDDMPEPFVIIWPAVIWINLLLAIRHYRETNFKPYYTLDVTPSGTSYGWSCNYHVSKTDQQLIKSGETNNSQEALELAQEAIESHKDQRAKIKEETFHRVIPA